MSLRNPPRLAVGGCQCPDFLGQEVLDVACGTGQTTKTIIDCYPNANVYGIDISERMLQKAQENIPHAYFQQTTLEKFASDNQGQKYDLIVCIGALEFFPNLEQFFLPASRLLAPSGCIFFTYEPQIQNLLGQYKLEESVFSKESDSSRNLELKTFRRSSFEISNAAKNTGLNVQDLNLFKAYDKGKRPVIYAMSKAISLLEKER